MRTFTRLCVTALLIAATLSARASTIPISDIVASSARQDYGQLQYDRDTAGAPLRVGGRAFEHGLGMHANGEATFDLEGAFERFEAWVGVDDSMIPYKGGSVVFRVVGDGKTLYDSGLIKLGDPAKPVTVAVNHVRELKLVVTDGGDGINCDHADWGDAILTGTAAPSTTAGEARYTLKTVMGDVRLSGGGEVVSLATFATACLARTQLAGCQVVGQPRTHRLAGGAISFTREMRSFDGTRRCVVTDTFSPTRNSLRWEVVIHGKGSAWSTPINTIVRLPVNEQTRFWTGWYTPQPSVDGWQDPLQPTAVHPMRLSYGDSFCLPMATLLQPDRERALTVALSPQDLTLGLTLGVGRDGAIMFSRTNLRISPQRPVRFCLDLVPHSDDIRGGLAWMVDRYPGSFNPPNADAAAVCGGGAYSGFEGKLDVDKMRAMAFGVNWKASFDFPYMSMFLPPVPKETDKWRRFDADSGGNLLPNVKTYSSRMQMQTYSESMRQSGFHVLNYFNVTEFGAGIKARNQIDKALASRDAWKDATTYLYTRIADGILPNERGEPIGTWGAAVVMDCGGANYRRHLLEQAQRHIDKLPSSSGICIDRTDWLRFYNPKADDGVSWFNGKPARSVQVSWNRLMADLGPMMHKAHKVIFANTLNARLDILPQVDGIYAEFGNRPGDFNAAALMGLRKPVIQWTASEGDLKPDPDAFFQRHLYMGAFPTVPYPGNDHTITPSEWAERYYLDYGPMLSLLRGRTWVLAPKAAQVDGDAAKANLFEVSDGYVAPVVFGGDARSVRLTLRGLRLPADLDRVSVTAYFPGGVPAMNLIPQACNGGITLDIPLIRGCAMVRITR